MPTPVVLVPGLLCSARLYAAQVTALWGAGPVMVADHTRADTMGALAEDILAAAPRRFALAGLSMGGYISLEILRRAPERVTRLALLDTSARPDTPEATRIRHEQIALAQGGRFAEVPLQQFPRLVHCDRHNDGTLRDLVLKMAEEVGAPAFVRQQRAVMTRPDSRPSLAAIGCPTVILVGEGDVLTPPEVARELAAGIRGAGLVVVPDSGHLSTLERPEAVNRALLDWLRPWGLKALNVAMAP
jgi:pimeloyl-ACP methyl ester carboxylesterase